MTSSATSRMLWVTFSCGIEPILKWSCSTPAPVVLVTASIWVLSSLVAAIPFTLAEPHLSFTDAVFDYVLAHGVREHPVLKKCREETAAMGGIAVMQIAPEQGAFMAMIAKLINAKRYIEVGTFTGYSALSVGQEKKITGHVGPAVASLDRLLREGAPGRYDYAFIDADKASYDDYYERMLKLVRPGGLIAIDNVLWSGKVAEPADTSADTVALRNLNRKIKGDERVDIALAPIADGIFLCRKR